jgi:hypothetical protein
VDVIGESKKINVGALIGGLVTLVTLVGGVLAIMGYLAQDPPNINGTWVIENVTENTSNSRYKNMRLTYRVVLVQNVNSFTGTGEKTGEQVEGKSLRELIGKERTPIEITGNVSGNSILSSSLIHASFVDHGTERESDGAFDWTLKNGAWRGTFSATAADSSGSSVLQKKP